MVKDFKSSFRVTETIYCNTTQICGNFLKVTAGDHQHYLRLFTDQTELQYIVETSTIYALDPRPRPGSFSLARRKGHAADRLT